jgi:hypothetical protein
VTRKSATPSAWLDGTSSAEPFLFEDEAPAGLGACYLYFQIGGGLAEGIVPGNEHKLAIRDELGGGEVQSVISAKVVDLRQGPSFADECISNFDKIQLTVQTQQIGHHRPQVTSVQAA